MSGPSMVTIPVEWCTTHRDVADRGEDSCGYSAEHPGRCVLVECYILEQEAS